MRFIVLMAIPYLAVFFETTFFASFSLSGVVPDLVLIFAVFFAVVNGSKSGAVYGFLCGLFEDLYLGRFIGMNALALGITCYIIGRLRANVFQENVLVGFGSVVLATVINAILMMLLGWLNFTPNRPDIYFFLNLSGQIAYNGILSVPIYIWYYKAAQRGFFTSKG